MMFKYALNVEKIKESDVIIDTSVDFASLSGAYIAHQGDFVNLFEPNATNIEKEGYGCVLTSLGQITGVVPYTAFYSKESFINNNKDKIAKFNKALNKGLEFVKNNTSSKIAEIILPEFPDISLNELTVLVERYKESDAWYDSTYVNIDDYKRLVDIMIYGKTIEKIPPIEILMTNEFNNNK